VGNRQACAAIDNSKSGAARQKGKPMSFLHRFSAISMVFLLGASALLLFPARAHAAEPGFDAYIGYSRLGSETFYANAGGLNGWEAAVHVKLKPLFGVEGDVAHYGLGADSSIPHTTTVLFGPRLTVGAAGIHVFVHGLLGGEHSSSSGPASVSGGTLAFALGGGADFRIAPFLSWRVAADFLGAPTQSPDGAGHDRFSTGLVFRF